MYECSDCGSAACCAGEAGRFPGNCSTSDLDRDDLLRAYADETDGELARQAARVEAGGYCRVTRIEEIMDFARRCGYKRTASRTASVCKTRPRWSNACSRRTVF